MDAGKAHPSGHGCRWAVWAPAAAVVVSALSGAAGAQPAGTTFQDCPECPVMVVVPAGSFLMDSSSGGVVMDPSSGELVGRWVSRRVTVPRPFAVGVYEVTRGQFARFVVGDGALDGGYLPYV